MIKLLRGYPIWDKESGKLEKPEEVQYLAMFFPDVPLNKTGIGACVLPIECADGTVAVSVSIVYGCGDIVRLEWSDMPIRGEYVQELSIQFGRAWAWIEDNCARTSYGQLKFNEKEK